MNKTSPSNTTETSELKTITILGAGAWGTALGLYLARRGQNVNIWSVEIAEIAAMLAERTNNRFLPGFAFPDSLFPTANLADAIKQVTDIIIAVPSIGFRETLLMLKPLIGHSHRIICATKGLDTETGQLLHEVLRDVLGKNCKFAALSGPSFAREVAAGLPAEVVIATPYRDFASDLMQRFNSDIFHVHLSNDVIGVEIGGVVKNVIAIAAGLGDGMQMGTSARCALITRGLAEMITFGSSLGARVDTLIGLSGIGDLMLTATDDLSRNRRLGIALGKGTSIEKAAEEIGQAIEGKRNAEQLIQLAKQNGIAMPICETIAKMLEGQLNPKETTKILFKSPHPINHELRHID